MHDRTRILNTIAHQIGARAYLEIGLRRPTDNFDHIEVSGKWAVDPTPPPTGPAGRFFQCSSDTFFQWLDCVDKGDLDPLRPAHRTVFDLIFIDGDHEYHQVCRDVVNAFFHLAAGGVIVLHDVLPASADFIGEPTPGAAGWCGDVWSVYLDLVENNDPEDVCAIAEEDGIGILSATAAYTPFVAGRHVPELAPFGRARALYNIIAEPDLPLWLAM